MIQDDPKHVAEWVGNTIRWMVEQDRRERAERESRAAALRAEELERQKREREMLESTVRFLAKVPAHPIIQEAEMGLLVLLACSHSRQAVFREPFDLVAVDQSPPADAHDSELFISDKARYLPRREAQEYGNLFARE